MPEPVRTLSLQDVASGDATLAELEGLTTDEAYAIANFGWMLLEQGRHAAAAAVFETLTLGNPRHAYFFALLGSARQRAGDRDGALQAYARALALDENETAALVNQAELLLGGGDAADVEEAATLLERAIALDERAERPETRRARALATALAERAQAALEPMV